MNTVYSLNNYQSLRQMLSVVRIVRRSDMAMKTGLRALKPVERLDDQQLSDLMAMIETGRYRISSANWRRLRERAHYMALQEFGNRQLRNERTADENRYDEDNRPEFPNVTWKSGTIRGTVIGLEDGRIARRIDAERAIPFCGVLSPVWLSDVERRQDGVSRVRWVTGTVQCSRCDGFHLSPASVASVPVASASETSEADVEVSCPHCHGISLRFEREGLLLTAHCLCGWEQTTSLIGLDPMLVEDNTRSILSAPVRDVEDDTTVLMLDTEERRSGVFEEESCDEELEELESGDLMETLVGMTDGSENALGTDHSDVSGVQEDLEEIDLDAVLTRQMVQFWTSWEQLELRRLLLDYTMRGELTPSMSMDETGAASCDRLALIWMVAATLTQGCGRMSPQQREELALWLVQSPDAVLRQFLPEGVSDADDVSLPNVYAKIRSWMRSCRQRVVKFRSESAGVRLLSRQFGVSETAFRTAIQLMAVA